MRARATIGLVALLLVAACSGNQLKFAEGNIADPEGFLTSVERAWKKDLADRDVAVHDQARCYFSRNETADALDEFTYCGPVRHGPQETPSSDDSDETESPTTKQQVARDGAWDTYRFTIRESDGEIVLSRPVPHLLGISIRANRTLIRPDDLEPPENAESFAERKVPSAGSDFVTTTEELYELRDVTTPEDGTIITPLTTLSVDEIGSVDTVAGDDGEQAPAKGESFRGLTLSFGRGPHANDYDDAEADGDSSFVDASVEYFVDHDGTHTPLFEDGAPDNSVTVIASVPDGGDTELVVSAAGEEQTISFATGERTSDTAAGFYADEAETDVDEEYPTTEGAQGSFSVSHYLRFDEAVLTPFHPQHGWAEDGNVWLVVGSSDTNLEWEDTDCLVTLERAESARVEVGGETVEDASESVEYEYFDLSDSLTFVFSVPEDEESFDFTYEPVITFRHPDGAASPPSGEVRLDPAEFSIDLSGE